MGKRLTFLVLLTLLPFSGQPLRGQPPRVGKDISKEPRQQSKPTTGNTQPSNIGTDANPLIVETHERTKSKEDAAEAHNNKKHATDIEGWTLFFAGFSALCTLILAIVGYLGVRTAISTLRAINEQSAHIGRQVDLMHASLAQWVLVENWQTTISRSADSIVLNLNFDVANKSNFPLTMESKIGFFGRLPNAATFMGSQPLFPNRPYTATVHLYITDQQFKDYLGGMLRIAVHGDIFHVGVSGSPGPLMSIHGNLVCGSNTIAHMESESIEMRQITTEPKPNQAGGK